MGWWNPSITPKEFSEKFPSFMQLSHGRHA
jgi:hypothetical protein